MTTESAASLLHLAGSKLRSQLGGQLNESASQGVTSKFARAQLEKLGWKEGEGLGKRRQGMATHIKVKKRADGVGLGESNLDLAVQQSIGNEWWKNSVGDTLARLGSKKSKKKSSKKEKKEKKKTKRIYTDEELFEATGGARFGMRAQTQQHGKWKRAEAGISEQEVEEAKNKVEWDGKVAPMVILSEKKKKKSSKKRARQDDDTETSVKDDDDTEQKAKKKKRKKEETKLSKIDSNENHTATKKKKDKKKKKSKS